jgi:phosphohistidine phosphatase SixA
LDLFLVRHGLAEDPVAGRDDADRALTGAGRDLLLAGTLPQLEQAACGADRLLHSPWRRAAETAALLRPCALTAPESVASLAAAPHSGMLKDFRGLRVIAVGHKPWLTELAVLLCWGTPATAAGALRLPKGGVVWLRGDLRPAAMRLRALWPPAIPPER